ncbi:ExbD/TolR family protein [Jiella avicenniae]|uniref:Biopolymer transporter ExbD n=1 Tax=Jiella avicenniae TaxID=2907202 RepID=A0A9X1P1N2_9HYPH|nr:biopolymer transporter ExbD [Jiella avicenniae]MCE7027658.1 biopolymer transporter ExbD [Jiella avicenniae]MCE7028700.1 biopolymer transporter ExbD [Jiella avicenniae]
MRRVRARTRRRFVLTPLVDVIFLLVIFFALSSRIAPFGLIPVSGQGRAVAGAEGSETASRTVAPADETLVVLRGRARLGAQVYALDALRPAAVRLREGGARSVLLLTARSARTEDVAKALDALRRAGVANVRLISAPADTAGTRGGAGPR